MKLGAITNGISYNLKEALDVMKEYGLDQVELQFINSKPDGEIGNQSEEEIHEIKSLVDSYGMKVCSLTRHLFQGVGVMDVETDSDFIRNQMGYLEKLVHYARILSCPIIRTMSFSKTMIIHGYDGADEWNAGNNKSWGKLLKLMEVPVKYAEDNNVTLAVETGNNAMITSGYLAKKLITDLGTKNLKVMWDPANSLFCADVPFPDAYEEIKDVMGHIHMKDVRVNIPKAEVVCCPLGEGDMAPYLKPLADALKKDNYGGVISFESVYRPYQPKDGGGSYLDGFRASADKFIELFR